MSNSWIKLEKSLLEIFINNFQIHLYNYFKPYIWICDKDYFKWEQNFQFNIMLLSYMYTVFSKKNDVNLNITFIICDMILYVYFFFQQHISCKSFFPSIDIQLHVSYITVISLCMLVTELTWNVYIMNSCVSQW